MLQSRLSASEGHSGGSELFTGLPPSPAYNFVPFRQSSDELFDEKLIRYIVLILV